MMKNNYKGFLFTLDAIFSLVIASLAVSTLLYVSFVTPVASNSQNDKASSILNSMMALSTGSALGNGSISGIYSNPYISYNPNLMIPLLSGSSYIRYNKNIPDASANAITISVWVYPTGVGSGTGAGNTASALNGSGGMILSSANSYQLARFPNGQLYYSFNTIGLSWIDTGQYIPVNRWSNIVLTYSKATGSLSIYDNSTLITSASFTGALSVASSPCIAQFSIGSNCYSNQNFYGSIMNAQVYDTALSTNYVDTIYKEGIFGIPVGKSSLLGWWPLDGNANDYSGNDNKLSYGNITFTNTRVIPFGSFNVSGSAPLLQTAADLYLNGYGGYASEIMNSQMNSSDYGLFIDNKYAPALNIADFNGTTSYINVTGPMNLENFTISTWVMTTSLKNETIETGNPSGSNHMLEIFNGNSICSNKIPISGYLFVGGYNNVHVCSGIPVLPDKWYNIVTTYNQNSIDIYVNGELNSTYLSSGTPGASSFDTIGNCLTCTKYAFDGYIANMQIFNSTLNAAQIAAAYSFGIGGIPISNKKIEGWWPLDGNTNDYTNNYNTGIPANIIYQNTSYVPIALTNSYLVSRGSTTMELHNGKYISIDNVSIVVWK